MSQTGRLSDVLVYTRTAAYRHDSIPAGRAALRELGEEHGFGVEATEDPSAFTDASLAGRDAVVFLSTSGDVLTPEGRDALRRWVADGGGFMGVHSAACTEYDWPYYGELVGARFAGHPAFQPGAVRIEDPDHPATRHLPRQWNREDEWYDFRATRAAPGSGSWPRSTRRATRAAAWERTTRWSGAGSPARAAPSTHHWATRSRPTKTRPSAPTSSAGCGGRPVAERTENEGTGAAPSRQNVRARFPTRLDHPPCPVPSP